MKIALKNPLCFFDLETTGLSITQDRIVQIAIIKLEQDGSSSELNLIINPEVTISKENALIHGITNEIASKHKNFKEQANQIIEFIGNSDLAGYNSNKFDIPFLAEELIRNNVEFDLANRQFVDIQNIFHKMEQRTLYAAYKFYCDKKLENIHDALYDAKATMEVLMAQVTTYDDLENNVEFLSKFSRQNTEELIDFAGRLTLNKDNEVVYNFGKHKGKTIKQVSISEPGYYGWILNADFPLHTKQCLKKEMDKIKSKKIEQDSKEMENKLNQLKNKFKS